MTGAEYIAEFLKQRGIEQIFLITGGACAFIVDAIGRHPALRYVCFQHEQAAAMAADASWRTQRKVGATVVTSGPGATNLVTGIACSYFDSIPTIHITGQVNQHEKAEYRGARVRQAGFQETKIVEMVRPITKYAVAVTNGKELKQELTNAYNIAISARMGPVLIDVPMDVQKEDVGPDVEYAPPSDPVPSSRELTAARERLSCFFESSTRPLVLFGAGVGLSGAHTFLSSWLTETGLPFVSSWNALTYFDHDHFGYFGHIGVYGNRGANFLVQNCDRLLVLGSRLDNRQRSGDAKSFATGARVLAIDVDQEELAKYDHHSHFDAGIKLDLAHLPRLLAGVVVPGGSPDWHAYAKEMKEKYFGNWPSTSADRFRTMSPYDAVQKINGLIDSDAIVIADDGANLCWVFQSFHRRRQNLFTAGGNSPMGYSFPAAIGAALYCPSRQVIAFTGDGSMQMNIQELQTLRHHNLNIKLFILNNFGYGIIKQFQDLYFGGRHHATGHGYSQPDFGRVADAYGVPYKRIERVEDIDVTLFQQPGPMLIDLILHPETLIEPKVEMGHSIEDQFPYMSNDDYASGMRYVFKKRI